MQKKHIFLCGITAVSAVAAVSLLSLPSIAGQIVKGDMEYNMVLDANTVLEAKDEGFIQQADVKETKIDFVGFTEANGALGSIKRESHGDYTFNGMVYNRSVINGFKSMKVTFTGGDLHYVFTDFLMENMNFDGANTLESGTTVNVPDGEAYFLIYNLSETPVTINEIKLVYSCDASIDTQAIFDANSTTGGARSNAGKVTWENGYVEIQNNPATWNNNYSTGTVGDHAASWYRWCGRYFRKSASLGTDFTFGLTVAGNYSQVVDENERFHFAVWPELASDPDEKELSYIQTYIGNDNYEPLGKDHALRPTDPYVQQSYPGRFFTDYGWYNEQWMFCDPDTTKIADGVTTFRQAYEAYNLPFWFITFRVYLEDVTNEPLCDVSINGFHLYTQEIFDKYDKVNTPDIHISRMQLHVVNYGVDADGTPDDPYSGCFTFPRLVA